MFWFFSKNIYTSDSTLKSSFRERSNGILFTMLFFPTYGAYECFFTSKFVSWEFLRITEIVGEIAEKKKMNCLGIT